MVGLDPRSKEILTNDIYAYNAKTDSYMFSGRSYLLERIAKRKGISVDEIKEDLERRRTILEWMMKQDIKHFGDVSSIIREYYAHPQRVYKRAIRRMM